MVGLAISTPVLLANANKSELINRVKSGIQGEWLDGNALVGTFVKLRSTFQLDI